MCIRDSFPGVPEVSGAELADRMFSQALGLGADAELAEVTAVSPAPGGFTVSTPDGDYAAKAVVLATGAQHRKLGVDREDELAGNGVCYCAVCDGAFYKALSLIHIWWRSGCQRCRGSGGRRGSDPRSSAW